MAYGLALTVDDIMEMERLRAGLRETVTELFDRVDVLALPTTQVLPFPADQEFPTEVAGQAMPDYLGWMMSCCVITATECPAISIPAGFHDGLPAGLQLVGRPGADRELLRWPLRWKLRVRTITSPQSSEDDAGRVRPTAGDQALSDGGYQPACRSASSAHRVAIETEDGAVTVARLPVDDVRCLGRDDRARAAHEPLAGVTDIDRELAADDVGRRLEVMPMELVFHGVDVERNRVLTSGLGHGECLGLVGELGWLTRKLHSDDRRRIVVAVPAGAERQARS